MMLRLIILLGLGFGSLISCSGDDNCSEGDWEGIYRGVKSTDGVIEDDYLFEVRRSTLPIGNPGDEISGIINYSIDGITMSVTDCDITGGETVLIGLTNYSGSLDGDMLNIVIEEGSSRTTYAATKE